MKKIIFLFLNLSFFGFAQINTSLIVEDVDEEVYLINYLETDPIYPGCEKENDKEKMNCLKENIKSFILDNSNKKLKKYLKQNKLNLNFTHQKDGTLTLNELKSDKYKVEIENIISKLPKVIPATQRNRPIKFNFEIIFDY
jgi:hypothetical protein